MLHVGPRVATVAKALHRSTHTDIKYICVNLLNAWEGGEKNSTYRPTFEYPKVGKTTLFSTLGPTLYRPPPPIEIGSGAPEGVFSARRRAFNSSQQLKYAGNAPPPPPASECDCLPEKPVISDVRCKGAFRQRTLSDEQPGHTQCDSVPGD